MYAADFKREYPFYHGTFECKILGYRISSLYNLKETLILTSWTL